MKTCVFAALCAVPCLSLRAGISFDAPGHVYTDKEQPTARGGIPGHVCAVLDWRGRPTGTSVVWRADGSAAIPSMPTGYYRVKSGVDEATFAVVPIPEGRVRSRSSFYGVDSAMSGISQKGSFDCPWNGGDTFRTVSDLIWRAGPSHVRERMRWSNVNPEPDVYDYSRYIYNADLLVARRMSVSQVFHDAPPWAGVLKKLPSDLGAVFAFCRDTAKSFGKRVGDWEFWNEEDLCSFAPEPAWDYAAALKAASLGFRAGCPGVLVLPGGLSGTSQYVDTLFANDAAKFCDVYNFHIYQDIAQYPQAFGAVRELMESHGVGDMALWVTESGTTAEGNAENDSYREGVNAHSPDQELVMSEFYVKSQVAMQMEGVSRNYYFVFGAYNERGGTKDWGVMRRDGTVKPVFAAISAMTRELASASLLGELDVGEGLKAFLFSCPDGRQTVVFWSVSPMDTQKGGRVCATPDYAKTFVINAVDGSYTVSDMCGVRSGVACSGGTISLEATRFPAYIGGLRDLSVSIPARRPGKVKTYVPNPDEDLAVVLRVDFDSRDFVMANHNSRADMMWDSGRLRIQAWNLSNYAKSGYLNVSGSRLVGLPKNRQITLGPRGSPPATFKCRLLPNSGDDPFQTLKLTGVFGGKTSSRLVVPICVEKKLSAASESISINCSDPDKWDANTNADSVEISWDETEKAIRFDYSWASADTDRWFYPVYRLSLPRESLADAHSVDFEIKTAQNKYENDFVTQYLMLVYSSSVDGKRDKYLSYQAPISNWEKRYVSLEGESDALALVNGIRIGGNPKGTQCTMWLRNIRILKKKE